MIESVKAERSQRIGIKVIEAILLSRKGSRRRKRQLRKEFLEKADARILVDWLRKRRFKEEEKEKVKSKILKNLEELDVDSLLYLKRSKHFKEEEKERILSALIGKIYELQTKLRMGVDFREISPEEFMRVSKKKGLPMRERFASLGFEHLYFREKTAHIYLWYLTQRDIPLKARINAAKKIRYGIYRDKFEPLLKIHYPYPFPKYIERILQPLM